MSDQITDETPCISCGRAYGDHSQRMGEKPRCAYNGPNRFSHFSPAFPSAPPPRLDTVDARRLAVIAEDIGDVMATMRKEAGEVITRLAQEIDEAKSTRDHSFVTMERDRDDWKSVATDNKATAENYANIAADRALALNIITRRAERAEVENAKLNTEIGATLNKLQEAHLEIGGLISRLKREEKIDDRQEEALTALRLMLFSTGDAYTAAVARANAAIRALDERL